MQHVKPYTITKFVLFDITVFYVVTFFGGLPGLVASFVILRHKTHYRKRTFRRNMKLSAFLAMVLTRRINILTIIACFF